MKTNQKVSFFNCKIQLKSQVSLVNDWKVKNNTKKDVGEMWFTNEHSF